MPNSNRHKEWYTADEIAYVEGLGMTKSVETRIVMLENYLNGMKLRKDWAGMSKGKVTKAVLHTLSRVRRGAREV